MNKSETAKVVAYLHEAYPNGKEITDLTIEVWYDILKDYEFKVVQAAMRELVNEWDGYTMPPPAALIKKIRGAEKDNVDIDLWNEAEKLISKGTILTAEEFRQASPEIQRYFGSVSRIRDLALMPAEETANERARFLKQVPSIRENIRLRKSLPAEVIAMIDGMSERKQLQ